MPGDPDFRGSQGRRAVACQERVLAELERHGLPRPAPRPMEFRIRGQDPEQAGLAIAADFIRRRDAARNAQDDGLALLQFRQKTCYRHRFPSNQRLLIRLQHWPNVAKKHNVVVVDAFARGRSCGGSARAGGAAHGLLALGLLPLLLVFVERSSASGAQARPV